MEKVHTVGSSSSAAAQVQLNVPDCVPAIGEDALDAALTKSAKARRLHAHLCAREAEGKPLSAAEVTKVVKAADGEQAVVIAAHAQSNPDVYGGAFALLEKFLARIEWSVLIGDLEQFIAGVRAREADANSRRDIKNDLERDRLDFDLRRAALLRMERANADRPPVDDALSASNQLRFTLERLKTR